MATKNPKITSRRLRTYLDAKKNETVLIGAVDRHLQRSTDFRDYTYLHPSDMANDDFCERAAWYEAQGRIRPPEALTIRSNTIFAEGHAVHDKWQGWLADMGVLWGQWKCRVCGEHTRGWSNEIGGFCHRQVQALDNPGIHLWQYEEVPVESASRNIKGHADGIANPTGDESVLLEVKSIGPGTLRKLGLLAEDEADEKSADVFARITHPLASHFLQTQIYLRLARQHWKVVGEVRRAVVIYEHKADQQVREFVITYDDKWTEHLFDLALDIQWAIFNGREIVCPRGGCPRCKQYEEEK